MSVGPASNSLCLTPPLGSHVATLATALLKTAASCIFGESTSLLATASTLYASATPRISTTACEGGVTAAKRVWPWATFLYYNLFCANSMWVGGNGGIVASGIRKLHKGTILGMLVVVLILGG